MKITFRVHAIKRMAQRNISKNDVAKVLTNQKLVENYPNDTPYPSKLLLGWSESRPLHVVAAYNKHEDEYIIITVYEPSSTQWESNFINRRET